MAASEHYIDVRIVGTRLKDGVLAITVYSPRWEIYSCDERLIKKLFQLSIGHWD